jgi:hypothetical protein
MSKKTIIKILKIIGTILKYLILLAISLFIGLLTYVYFEPHAKAMTELTEKNLTENMHIKEMDLFMKKYHFVCQDSTQPHFKTCFRETSPIFLLAYCDHRVSFKINNNKVKQLEVMNRCVGL